MSDKIEPCPCLWCGHATEVFHSIATVQFVGCTHPFCGAVGPVRNTREAAISAWNEVAKLTRDRDAAREDAQKERGRVWLLEQVYDATYKTDEALRNAIKARQELR